MLPLIGEPSQRSSTVGALQIQDLKMGDQMSGPDIWSFIFRSCIFWSCIFSAPLYCTDLYVIRRTAIARNHGKRSNLSPIRRVAKVSCRQTACDWAPGRKRSHGNFIQLTVKWDGIILSCCIIFTVVPSVLWRRWLGGRKGIRPVKKLSCGVLHGYLSGARYMAYGPADATATHCLLLQ